MRLTSLEEANAAFEARAQQRERPVQAAVRPAGQQQVVVQLEYQEVRSCCQHRNSN